MFSVGFLCWGSKSKADTAHWAGRGEALGETSGGLALGWQPCGGEDKSCPWRSAENGRPGRWGLVGLRVIAGWFFS